MEYPHLTNDRMYRSVMLQFRAQDGTKVLECVYRLKIMPVKLVLYHRVECLATVKGYCFALHPTDLHVLQGGPQRRNVQVCRGILDCI